MYTCSVILLLSNAARGGHLLVFTSIYCFTCTCTLITLVGLAYQEIGELALYLNIGTCLVHWLHIPGTHTRTYNCMCVMDKIVLFFFFFMVSTWS